MEKMRIKGERGYVELYNEEEDTEEEVWFPIKFEVCDMCRGKGSHVNPSVDGNGISPEEFSEDPDFADAYFGGLYDVQCYECGGEKVVAVIDEESVKRHYPEKLDDLKLWHEALEEEYAYQRERESERRYGA